MKHYLKISLFCTFFCACFTVESVMYAGTVNRDVLFDYKLDLGEKLLGVPTLRSTSPLFFHDSVSKSGFVLHGRLKYTHDSLVSQWMQLQSDSLRLEKSNSDDLERLIKEIEAEVLSLEQQKRRGTVFFGVLIMVLFVVFLLRKKLRLSKNIFSNVRKKVAVKSAVSHAKNTVNISDDTVEVLSHLLAKFEKEHGFLEANMTLNLLAQNMQTNSTYLSKVVNHTKGVNFSAYLNDLRIRYIIEQLSSEPKLSQYTNKALATEAGYKTRESFTKAFYKKMGEYPAAYISRLHGRI